MKKIAMTALALAILAAPAFGQEVKEKTKVTTHEHGTMTTTTHETKVNGHTVSKTEVTEPNWNRVTWSNVAFVNRKTPTIGQVVSTDVLNRLHSYSTDTLHYTDPLTGAWTVQTPTKTIYMVRSGKHQVAQLVDSNGDGKVDYVLLYHNK